MTKIRTKRTRLSWLGPLAVLSIGFVLGVAAPAESQQATVTAPTVVKTDYDMRQVVLPPSLSEAEVKGRKLFVQRCALCHDPLGQPSFPRTVGPWVDSEGIKALGEDAVRNIIMTGSVRMPGWRYTLEPSQIDQIIAYLKTVTPDQKPQAPAGRGSQPGAIGNNDR
jgi:mono/diheme cytochrome c family protein